MEVDVVTAIEHVIINRSRRGASKDSLREWIIHLVADIHRRQDLKVAILGTTRKYGLLDNG